MMGYPPGHAKEGRKPSESFLGRFSAMPDSLRSFIVLPFFGVSYSVFRVSRQALRVSDRSTGQMYHWKSQARMWPIRQKLCGYVEHLCSIQCTHLCGKLIFRCCATFSFPLRLFGVFEFARIKCTWIFVDAKIDHVLRVAKSGDAVPSVCY